MRVEKVARGVYLLHFPVRHVLNCFLVHGSRDRSGVLIDAGTPFCAGRLLRQIDAVAAAEGPSARLEAHALTHAHPDHNGSSSTICGALGLRYLVGDGDAPVARGDVPMIVGGRSSPARHLPHALWSGAAHPVDACLQDGDELGCTGFRAVATPGHTAGHLCFYREEDGVLIGGDAVANHRVVGDWPGLSMPPWFVNTDTRAARESVHRIAALGPSTVCFGHGHVLRDGADALRRFSDGLRRAHG